jgi:hypothetical protein
MCLPISVSSQVSANYRSACDVVFKEAGKEHSLITPLGIKSMNHIYEGQSEVPEMWCSTAVVGHTTTLA